MHPVRRRSAAAVAVVAALCASGCDEVGTADAAPRPTGQTVATLERPHFEGARELVLAVGEASASSDCDEDSAPEWVCDPEADRPAPGLLPHVGVVLREARMDLTHGGTSWRVTLRFAHGDRADLAATKAEAARLGAPVLLLDADRVLVVASADDVGASVIRLSRMAKPDAWDTVERAAGT